MSTNAQHKANLARIRDNQRRSRARRREYVHELEQRLRSCELQGVEASAEVQGAARKVAEENRRLRVLLNKHGISDDSITQFLQGGATATPNYSASQISPTGGPGAAVQSLQNVIGPRRPSGLNASVMYSMPRDFTREGSAVSVTTSSPSSPWEPPQLATPVSQSQTPQLPHVLPAPMLIAAQQHQGLHIYTETSTPRSQAMPGQQPLISPDETYQQNYTVQPILFNHQNMSYSLPLNYQNDPEVQFPSLPSGC